jgi:Superinfection immunity protein
MELPCSLWATLGGVMFSGFFIVLILFLAIYFLPWIVALVRNAPRMTAIFVLNLLLGWTVIGWVIALVWAFAEMPRTEPQSITVNTQVPPAAPAAQSSNPKTIVVSVIMTAPSLASALLEQPALLVRQEQDGQVQWRVDAESGPVGRVEGEDAARIEFNASAVGRPRAVFRTVAPQLTLGVTFGA